MIIDKKTYWRLKKLQNHNSGTWHQMPCLFFILFGEKSCKVEITEQKVSSTKKIKTCTFRKLEVLLWTLKTLKLLVVHPIVLMISILWAMSLNTKQSKNIQACVYVFI